MNILPSTCKTILVFCLLLCATIGSAQTITGTVHNETAGKPSAGDDVVLLRLDNGMLEETHTKTDDQGAFTLNVQFPDLPHIVRVLHQGVNYDQTVASKVPLDIKVFDAAAKVQEVTGYISIVKVESDGKNFNITELHAVNNLSNPQRTQANPKNFELSLPAQAQMDSVMVAGPGGIQVKADLQPVAGKEGHYVIGFPLRPGGLTRYWVKYHLPYQDRVVFHPVLSYASQMYSVQYPKSMTFVTAEKGGFHPILDQDGMKVEAINAPKAGSIPVFQLSGVGALPPDAKLAEIHSRTVPAQSPASAAANRDRGQSAARPNGANSSQRSSSQGTSVKALAIIVLGISVLAVLAFLIWRAQATKRQVAREALKEKLFQLENDRLKGSISAEQYAATKETLNQSLEQVVGKRG